MDGFPALEIRASRGGHGVFACEAIRRGMTLMTFTGPLVDRAAIEPVAAAGGHDGFLQVGEDRYLGLSGGADDFVNHACDPNAYIQVGDGGVLLIALRNIRAGSEITFDYGVTQVAFPFRFTCACGSPRCRGEIGNYDEIPLRTLARYRRLGMVPPHVLARLDAGAAVRRVAAGVGPMPADGFKVPVTARR